ncbi:MAG: RNA polymerase sigma factor RpoD/SigA [Fibrobacterota bacterium]
MALTSRFRNDQDFVNQYLKEIRPYPKLEREEERELLNQYKDTGDKKALDKLITSNLRFVVSVSVKYQNQGLSMPELINEGNLGLIEATKRFRPSDYSVKFISYAVWWIRQSIIKALYEKSRLVRVSAEKESKLKRVNRMTELSLQEFGRIDYDFVARKSEAKTAEVEQILSLGSNRVSMDEPLGDDNDANIYDLIPDDHTEAPDDVLEREGLHRSVSDMIETLNDQEQKVVRHYFGIDRETEFNLEQIGKKLRISKERVRQIKKRALEKMKASTQNCELAFCA